MTLSRCRRAARNVFAAACLSISVLHTQSALASTQHPTVAVNGQHVSFYAGHLVLDARGSAELTDGFVRVQADHIIVDLRANRYVAAGDVTVTGADMRHGDALGVDLATHSGVLLSATAQNPKQYLSGSSVGPAISTALPQEPLALPDIGFEQPYATAKRAVAHLNADVRLAGARIIVPGGESVPLPSYVFTFSSDPGYAITNLNTGNEDVPIYFGSTPNSIQGIHFSYNPQIKVAIGLDDHIVFGNRAYDLLSFGPLIGPNKIFNFTWQHHINEHASQTLNSSTAFNFGTINNYDLRDSIHRSFLDFSAVQFPGSHSARLTWQSFDQMIGSPPSRKFYFHLSSEYGYSHVSQSFSFAPFSAIDVLPNTVFHKGLSSFLGTQPFNLGPRSTISASADIRGEADTLPHRQLLQSYSARLDHRWNRIFETTLADNETPVYDVYPSVQTAYHTRFSSQTLQLSYDHGDPFALRVGINHAAARSENPFPPFVLPWFLTADVRFRVNQSLSIDLNRSYFFGYGGQRFGSVGFQILP